MVTDHKLLAKDYLFSKQILLLLELETHSNSCRATTLISFSFEKGGHSWMEFYADSI